MLPLPRSDERERSSRVGGDDVALLLEELDCEFCRGGRFVGPPAEAEHFCKTEQDVGAEARRLGRERAASPGLHATGAGSGRRLLRPSSPPPRSGSTLRRAGRSGTRPRPARRRASRRTRGRPSPRAPRSSRAGPTPPRPTRRQAARSALSSSRSCPGRAPPGRGRRRPPRRDPSAGARRGTARAWPRGRSGRRRRLPHRQDPRSSGARGSGGLPTSRASVRSTALRRRRRGRLPSTSLPGRSTRVHARPPRSMRRTCTSSRPGRTPSGATPARASGCHRLPRRPVSLSSPRQAGHRSVCPDR